MKPWFANVLMLLLLAVAFTPGAARADVRTEARRAFRHGMELIQQGQIDEGVASLEQAYEILPHPNVLYNIGRAYAEAGRYEEAIEYFERYLDADPPDREEVQGFLEALQDRVAARQQAEAAQQQAAQTPTETTATTTTTPEDVEPMATDEEIRALDDASTQIAALAEATMSDSLRERAARLHELAEQLRERRDAQQEAQASGGQTGHGDGQQQGGGALPEPGGLDIGAQRGGDDLYAEQVVSSSRFAQSPLDAPNSTTNITSQDIHLIGHNNIAEMMRRVAGADVMTTSPADVQVGIRGFNQRLSPRVLVLIDGRSVYVDTLGTTFWGIMPFGPEDIERIEVIRGPASALYGADAFSGIVNIITRAPGAQHTDAMLGFGNGTSARGHVSTSGHAGRLGYRIAAGYDRADRFSAEVSPERASTGDFDVLFDRGSVAREQLYANGRLQYRLNRDVTFELAGGLNDNQQNFQGTGPLRDLFARGPNGFALGSVRSNWGSLRVFWNGTKAISGPQSFPRGGDSGVGRFVSNTVDVEGEFAHDFHLLVDHNLHIGLNYRLKTIDWEYLDDTHTENHFGVFFQDTAHIVDQLIAVASFRVDFHPLLDTPVFSPRGALVFRPSEGQAIRASVGTAFRTQTFLESYLNLYTATPVAAVTVLAQGSEVAARNNPDFQKLSPENILSAELGYRNAESDYFDVEASVYYNRITNTVSLTQIQPYRLGDFAAGVDGYNEANASTAIGTLGFQNEPAEFDVVGGELSTRVYPVTGLDVYANYAYNRSFVSNSPLREREERTSRHKLNFGVQYRSRFGLDLGVDFHYASRQVWLEQTFDAVEGVKLSEFDQPGYYMINARVGYRLFDDQLELGLVGYNLTDNRHREHPFGQELSLRLMGTAAYHF